MASFDLATPNTSYLTRDPRVTSYLQDPLLKRLHNKISEAGPLRSITIDLTAQTVTDGKNARHEFAIGAFEKKCLLEGLDDVDLTLRHLGEIEAFEGDYRKAYDWLFPITQ